MSLLECDTLCITTVSFGGLVIAMLTGTKHHYGKAIECYAFSAIC